MDLVWIQDLATPSCQNHDPVILRAVPPWPHSPFTPAAAPGQTGGQEPKSEMMESWNHRLLMAGRDLKAHPVPPSLSKPQGSKPWIHPSMLDPVMLGHYSCPGPGNWNRMNFKVPSNPNLLGSRDSLISIPLLEDVLLFVLLSERLFYFSPLETHAAI